MSIPDLLLLLGAWAAIAVIVIAFERWNIKNRPILYTTVDEFDNSLTFEVKPDISDDEYQRRLKEMTNRLAGMRKAPKHGAQPGAK